ncbi:hypothetical protein POM88_042348 [Heracleum sosnowskyi]|uniref:Uncharacterized protein n=1 Tax=Heracleum sosnowskyi TaxID=360622 RepID=A0AAD8HG17_9APIA|nr:hypothetical protein POM88_042348 [Heracleum sosnowskyi]
MLIDLVIIGASLLQLIGLQLGLSVSSHFGVFNNHSAFILNKSQINLTYLQALNIMVWIKLQSTLNHVWMSGLLGDGFGAAYGMMRNVIVWVLSRMHLQEDHHPIWEVPRD